MELNLQETFSMYWYMVEMPVMWLRALLKSRYSNTQAWREQLYIWKVWREKLGTLAKPCGVWYRIRRLRPSDLIKNYTENFSTAERAIEVTICEDIEKKKSGKVKEIVDEGMLQNVRMQGERFDNFENFIRQIIKC